MRKIIVSMNATLDGFIAGPDCELDWHFQSWDDEMAGSTAEQLSRADTILLGRVTYKAMAAYWPVRAINLCAAREDVDFTDMMNSYKKIVFSSTLKNAAWNNSRIVRKDAEAEINRLRKEPGKDMIIYGSVNLISYLEAAGLIDEYRLWVHPVMLGKGKGLFRDLKKRVDLELYKTKTFRSGVILLYYQYVQ